MKHLACLALSLGLAIAVPLARAQEHAPEKAAEHSAEQAPGPGEHSTKAETSHGGMDAWKWANFALLALALGYMIRKNAGPFFTGRSAEIRRDLVESRKIRAEAEARAAEMDQRLANLGAEIAALRAAAQNEAEVERGRLSRHTAAELAKIQAQAEREIESAGKAARVELKRYSAQLAIGLAEQKIRARMTPDSEAALVERFVQNLK